MASPPHPTHARRIATHTHTNGRRRRDRVAQSVHTRVREGRGAQTMVANLTSPEKSLATQYLTSSSVTNCEAQKFRPLIFWARSERLAQLSMVVCWGTPVPICCKYTMHVTSCGAPVPALHHPVLLSARAEPPHFSRPFPLPTTLAHSRGAQCTSTHGRVALRIGRVEESAPSGPHSLLPELEGTGTGTTQLHCALLQMSLQLRGDRDCSRRGPQLSPRSLAT